MDTIRHTIEYHPPACEGLVVLYCDAHLLALEKPAGLLSVPGRGSARHDSLSVRVQREYPEALVVHRLDMDTSGVLLMARNPRVQGRLGRLFQERQVEKYYVAVVEGSVAGERGEVDLPLRTDWPNRPRQMVDQDRGKAALTRYRILERDAGGASTRVLLAPETGRSHQLRVHMAAIGHAILGDRLYAREETRERAPRLLLHACELTLRHPVTGEAVRFQSPPPF